MQKSKANYKYQKLYSTLKAEIDMGRLKPGDRLPTQRELMANSHLSYATVNSALSQLEREARVVRRHGKGTFVTDPAETAARITLGVLGVSLGAGAVSPAGVLKGIYEASREQDIQLEFLVFQGCRTRLEICEKVVSGQFDTPVGGILIPQRHGYAEVMKILDAADFPSLIMDAPMIYPGSSQILSDHEAGARQAVQHLIDHGHTRIACIMATTEGEVCPGDDWNVAKLSGYKKALQQAGIAFTPELLCVVDDITAKGGRIAAERLLTVPDWTGAFVACGGNPPGVIDTLRAHGKRVPQDIAIVSFNVIEYEDNHLQEYDVSGIDIPLVDIGHEAVSFLAEIVANPASRPAPPYVRDVPPRFIRRTSCGCA